VFFSGDYFGLGQVSGKVSLWWSVYYQGRRTPLLLQLVHHLRILSTAGQLHARFGILSWTTITAQWSSKGIKWLADTVCLELIRHKDGSIVSISKISEVMVSNCSSLMLWNLQRREDRFWMKELTFQGVKTYSDPSYIFSGGQDPTTHRIYVRGPTCWEGFTVLFILQCFSKGRVALPHLSALAASTCSQDRWSD